MVSLSNHEGVAHMAAKYKSDFLNVLDQRGFIAQISDPEGLDALAAKGPITGYVGYDATATIDPHRQPDHRHPALLAAGDRPQGDQPDGRRHLDGRRSLVPRRPAPAADASRRSTPTSRASSASTPTSSATTAPTRRIMVNNADWLLKLNYVEFLRDVGRYFSVNRMLSFDSVKTRLDREQSLSFLEFNYMIMQGYDFVELNRRYGTRAADGRHRPVGQHHQRRRPQPPHGRPAALRADHAAAHHGLGREDGQDRVAARSGSTATSSSPYDFWQYFRNTEDADVGKFLKIFTRLPLDEIAKLEALGGSELNEAKKILATEVTAIVHGREAAEQAAKTAAATFEAGALDLSLPTVDVATVRARRRLRPAVGARRRRSCRLERRGAPAHPVRRGARQRRARDRRAAGADGGEPAAGGRDQALRRQEEARAAEGDLVASLTRGVIPAKAGVHPSARAGGDMDPRLRRDDTRWLRARTDAMTRGATTPAGATASRSRSCGPGSSSAAYCG